MVASVSITSFQIESKRPKNQNWGLFPSWLLVHFLEELLNVIYPFPFLSIKSVGFLPLLQFLAFFLGGWKDHGKVGSVNLKKDAVL